MMHGYWYDAGEHMVEIDRVEHWPIIELHQVCGVVVAPTRGAAKAKFASAHSLDYIEFCDVSARIIQKNVDEDGNVRLVEDFHDPCHFLWDLVGSIIYGDAEDVEKATGV